MTSDESTTMRLKDVLRILLSPELRGEVTSSLTNDERRALVYQYAILPSKVDVDLNDLPEPPFPDREMNRLLISGTRKIKVWLHSEVPHETSDGGIP